MAAIANTAENQQNEIILSPQDDSAGIEERRLQTRLERVNRNHPCCTTTAPHQPKSAQQTKRNDPRKYWLPIEIHQKDFNT
jgi:hypothetical protein